MLRFPSIKTLSRIASTPGQAKAARLAFDTHVHHKLAELPGARELVRDSWCEPGTERLRLAALNRALDMHGVESLRIGNQYAEYLNAGDCYNETIIFYNGRYRVQTLGDFVETMERRGHKVA